MFATVRKAHAKARKAKNQCERELQTAAALVQFLGQGDTPGTASITVGLFLEQWDNESPK